MVNKPIIKCNIQSFSNNGHKTISPWKIDSYITSESVSYLTDTKANRMQNLSLSEKNLSTFTIISMQFGFWIVTVFLYFIIFVPNSNNHTKWIKHILMKVQILLIKETQYTEI